MTSMKLWEWERRLRQTGVYNTGLKRQKKRRKALCDDGSVYQAEDKSGSPMGRGGAPNQVETRQVWAPDGYGIDEMATSTDVALTTLRQGSRHLNLPVGYCPASVPGHHHARSIK